jgi:hypothetical protein
MSGERWICLICDLDIEPKYLGRITDPDGARHGIHVRCLNDAIASSRARRANSPEAPDRRPAP